jgi:hypothetical protein
MFPVVLQNESGSSLMGELPQHDTFLKVSIFYLDLENHILPRNAVSKMGVVRVI